MTDDELKEFPEHESMMRRMIAEVDGEKYESVRSLEEAKQMPDYALVMQGDWGGQIYLTCPVSLINCDAATLRQLLEDVDNLCWGDSDGAGMYFEHRPIGSGVLGGMGGGVVTAGLWAHQDFHDRGVVELIEDVITGKADRLRLPSLDELKVRAQAGDGKAQFLLAETMDNMNLPGAEQWYEKAALSGIWEAQVKMMIDARHDSGKFAWLEIMANRTDNDTKVNGHRLGFARLCETIEGELRNYEKAAYWYHYLCKNRASATAALYLGKLFLDGRGVQKDQFRALVLFLLAGIMEPPYWERGMNWMPKEDRESLEKVTDETMQSLSPEAVQRAQDAVEEIVQDAIGRSSNCPRQS